MAETPRFAAPLFQFSVGETPRVAAPLFQIWMMTDRHAPLGVRGGGGLADATLCILASRGSCVIP